jgi:hypothetical protein
MSRFTIEWNLNPSHRKYWWCIFTDREHDTDGCCWTHLHDDIFEKFHFVCWFSREVSIKIAQIHHSMSDVHTVAKFSRKIDWNLGVQLVLLVSVHFRYFVSIDKSKKTVEIINNFNFYYYTFAKYIYLI